MHQKVRDFQCELCHKSFAESGNYKRHVQSVHEKLRPFECDQCHKNFSTKGILKQHVKAVHQSLRPFDCDICQQKFSALGTLKKHVSIVHGKQLKNNSSLYHDEAGQPPHPHQTSNPLNAEALSLVKRSPREF